MSFDYTIGSWFEQEYIVSIPFDQGNVFRRIQGVVGLGSVLVSIPFDQGNVFRQSIPAGETKPIRSQSLSIRAMSFDAMATAVKVDAVSLNPFRSGQCLST